MISNRTPGNSTEFRTGTIYGSLLAYFTAVGVWAIVSLGLTSAMNAETPFAAAMLFGGDGATRLQAARALEPVPKATELAAEPDSSAARASRQVAIAGLVTDPLSVEAFRQLARSAQQSGDKNYAVRLLQESFRRFFRQPDVAVQLLQDRLAKGDGKAAMTYIDAILRTRHDLVAGALPLILALEGDPAFRPTVIEAIRTKPIWRTDFLAELARSPQTEDAFWRIYTALRQTNAAATPVELKPFLFSLVARDQVDRALSIWLSTFSDSELAKLPLLYNGDFRRSINDSPFNWSTSDVSGANIQIQGDGQEGGKQTLTINFAESRHANPAVSELVALAPGRYRLNGRVKTSEFQNARGLVWRVYCGSAAKLQLGETPRILNERTGFRPFAADFVVPSAACPIQLVRLELAARTPSEHLASGAVSFEDLSIEKTR